MSLQNSAAARLASALSMLRELGVIDRATHLGVLRQTLENHPRYLGVWAVWEPDALDGEDRIHAGTEAHDATGRFKPFWHRRSGDLCFEVNQDCDDPLLGRYYQDPVRLRRPVVIAPYEYAVGGGPALLATLAAPIMADGQCLGAVGVDFLLDTLALMLAAGTAEAAALIHSFEQDLDVGLIFLDRRRRVIACSDFTAAMLHGFIPKPLQSGGTIPRDLLPDPADTRGNMAEVVLEHHGASLKVTQSLPVRDKPTMLVVVKSMAEQKAAPLSTREQEVMGWLCEGKSNDEIGIILSISPHTVKNHLDRIYRKIGVDNRHAATLAWTRSKAPASPVPYP